MQNWHTELKRLLILLSTGILVGYFFGQTLLFGLLTLGMYSAFNIYQLRRLYQWLAQNPSESDSGPLGNIGLWGGVFSDIYRLQKQERKTSAYLESVINKAQESSAALEMAVIMIDAQKNLDWWNRTSESLLGLQYPKDKNQPVTSLIRDTRFAEYFDNRNYDEPLKINAPGESTKILEFQIALFGENERLMIVRDITQLHRLELMRKDFVGNVSHELGTPITVIKGYLEAIMENMDVLDKKWQKPLQQMHQQSLRMENIVRDLLLLSSLETKTLPKQQETANLSELLLEIKNNTEQIFIQKKHEYIIDCQQDTLIIGDRGELYSALSNLMSNAAKYTPAKGTILIKSQFDTDCFNIAIIDNGMGIESTHIPRLTERFYRVDVSRSSETGGTGLGLAIVKHILNRHNGELEIQSKIGKGSTFVCKLSMDRIKKSESKTYNTEAKE